MRFNKLLLCIISALLMAKCSPVRTIQTDLYFGQSLSDGSILKVEEWNGFVKNYVSKVFSNGSTIISTFGNWYDTASKKIIVEPTYIVSTVNKMNPRLSVQIDSLRFWYKTLFKQQSVLRVDKKAKMSLF